MSSAAEIAAAAAVVNQDTARLLGDKDVSKHISAPAPVGPDEYNPLAVSKNSGPLDYFPTLESRDIPKDTPVDGNELGAQQAALQDKSEKAEKAAEGVSDEAKGAIVEDAKTEALPDTSLKPGDSPSAGSTPPSAGSTPPPVIL